MSEKIKEPFLLKLKKKWIKNKATTILLILILITVFIALNLWVQSIDLAQIDVTENKIYTLTESSKKEISNIDEELKIYIYGYNEDSSLIDLVKQYCRENEKISYEILSEESNKDKIERYGLQNNYPVVILEVGERSTLIDAQTEFTSYDYTTGQEIDLTEQTITNAIVNLVIKNKPKVYLLTGHGEFTESQISVLTTFLTNEAYEYESINLLTQTTIPEDCDALLMISPTSDLLDNETNMILEYINNGGNIIYAKDTEQNGKSYPNFQKILDVYGLKVTNGYVYETNSDSILSGAPYIIMPKINSNSEITSELYSDGGYVLLPYAQKVSKSDEEKATSLNVVYETLLSTSEEAYYITDVSANISASIPTLEKEGSDVAILAIKTLNSDAKESEQKKSQILVIGNGTFLSNATIDANGQYPLCYLGNNKDFILNSIAYLTERTDGLKIRKEMNTSTYTPTAQQDIIVRTIIFGLPILIIAIGIVIWNRRKKKR